MSTVDRSKYLLVRYGTGVALALALVGVISLGGAWTAAQPTQTTEQVPIYQEEVSTAVGTSAVVTGNTTLYNESEVLRDRPVYLLAASPRLTIAVNTSLEADREANITHRLMLRFRATRDGETFWQHTRTYMNETRTVRDGELSTTETVNITAINRDAERFQSEIGGIGAFNVEFLLRVTYNVTEEPTYRGSFSTSAPLVTGSGAYWIGGDLSDSRPESEFRPRTTTVPADPIEYLGFGVVGVLALLGAAGSVLFRRDLDEEAIETRMYRRRYEEWISRGEIPTGTNKRYVRIDSLEDIVDIGIDSNKRVIWNEDYEIYAVVDGDIVYYYSAGSIDIDEWLNV